MNVIKYALICGYLISGSLIQGFAEDDISYDLEKIVTLRGKTYRDILIMDADAKGLFFRHRDGIAKLSFLELTDGLRSMYQVPDEEVLDDSEPREEPIESGGVIPEKVDVEIVPPVNVVIQYPIIVKQVRCVPPVYYRPWASVPAVWPSHWPRYHSVHNLVNPRCRAAVLQDFLYTTGLEARPPGVFVHRVRSSALWNFR